MKAFPGAMLHPTDAELLRKPSYAGVRYEIELARLRVRQRLAPWMDRHRAAPIREIVKAQAWFDKAVKRAFARHERTVKQLADAEQKARERRERQAGPRTYAEWNARYVRLQTYRQTGTLLPLAEFRSNLH